MGWFDWLLGAPTCPVEDEKRRWLDRRWRWLEREFGTDRVKNARMILPTPEFFPEPYRGGTGDARRLLDRVCGYMGVDPDDVDMYLYDESDPVAEAYNLGGAKEGSAGLYSREDGVFRIGIELATLRDPVAVIGTMAHELGHVHLLGGRRVSPREEDHEPLTDLLTVYLGLGVFTANSVVHEHHWREGNASGWRIGRRGYLRMQDYGYAFAKFARARGEDGATWSRELRPDVRVRFRQAMRFLAAEDLASSG